MSSWSCPHDIDNVCQRVSGARCDPGMRGCVLHGRFRFAADEDGKTRKPVKAAPDVAAPPAPGKPGRRSSP
jgi:hypothetical protein